MTPCAALPLKTPQTFILIDIDQCNTTRDRYGLYEYQNFGASEVVEASSARALVGRIFDNGKWTFVRREGNIEHAEYHDPVPGIEHEIVSNQSTLYSKSKPHFNGLW